MATLNAFRGRADGEIVEYFIAEARVFHGEWAPLPTWARSLVRLGSLIADENQDIREPSTVALALPTRAFAAVMSALGVVLRLAVANSQPEPARQFALLRALSPGATVIYHTDAGARFIGALVECQDDLVVIQPAKGSTILVHKRFADRVQPWGWPVTLPEYATSKAPPEHSAFMSALLGSDGSNLQTISRVHCGIVGIESALRAEAQAIRLGLYVNDGEVVEGTLPEVLAVRSLAPSTAFRSDIFSLWSSRRGNEWPEPPSVAIFDGATSFLKRGAYWPSASRLVLLDRTDRRLNDAIHELNRQYVQRCGEETPLVKAALDVPGAEAISYRIRPS